MTTQNIPETLNSVFKLEGGVATLMLDRDDIKNALTDSGLIEDILAVADWVNHNDEVACLIITGIGSAFSAGGNVQDIYEKRGMFSGTPTEVQNSYRRTIQKVTKAMCEVEVPTIAAVNGPAIGAGLDLACMCDIRVASENAIFGETFVNLGIIPGDGGAWLLPRVVGMQRAAELTFSGRIFDAKEALDMRLILSIETQDELMDVVVEMAHGFAAKPKDALRMSKRLLQAGQRMNMPDFLDFCAGLQSLCHFNDQHVEAMEAFISAGKKHK